VEADLAARILARFGESIDGATRPEDSQSNEVWLTDRVVLRIAAGFEPGYLTREARLALILPAEVGYPRILGSGTEDGREWIVAERLAGDNLGIVWPDLGEEEQTRAIESLWTRLAAVHEADVDAAIAAGCIDSPFYALDRAAAQRQLAALEAETAIDATMRANLAARLDDCFDAIDDVPRRVCHTDVGLKNALWDGAVATPIDFEFASVTPADLDLERWLWELREMSGTSAAIRWRELADEDLSRPGARARITGYRVLRDAWALGVWPRHAETEGKGRSWPPEDIREWRPWIDLDAITHGNDHFDPLFSREE
jgi:aminoglycoside phosphotransferase